jgi:hypothetical protein
MHQAIDQAKLRLAHPQLTDSQCLCQRCAAAFSKPLAQSSAQQSALGIDIGGGRTD